MAKNLSPPDRGKEKIVFLGLNNSMQFLWFACCNTHPLFTPIQNLTNTHPNSATNDNDSLHTTTHIECWILCCRAPHVCYFFGITHNNNCLFACRFKYFKLEITRCRLCCLPVSHSWKAPYIGQNKSPRSPEKSIWSAKAAETIDEHSHSSSNSMQQ